MGGSIVFCYEISRAICEIAKVKQTATLKSTESANEETERALSFIERFVSNLPFISAFSLSHSEIIAKYRSFTLSFLDNILKYNTIK